MYKVSIKSTWILDEAVKANGATQTPEVFIVLREVRRVGDEAVS